MPYFSDPAAGGAALAWTNILDVDLTLEPTVDYIVGGDGLKDLDGDVIYKAGNTAAADVFGPTLGTGLVMSPSTASTTYYAPAARTAPIFAVPLEDVDPTYDPGKHLVQVWGHITAITVGANYDYVSFGFEGFEFTARGIQATMYLAYNSGKYWRMRCGEVETDRFDVTYAGSPDVFLVRQISHSTFSFYVGVYTTDFPLIADMTYIATLEVARIAGANFRVFQKSELAFAMSVASQNGVGGASATLERLKIDRLDYRPGG